MISILKRIVITIVVVIVVLFILGKVYQYYAFKSLGGGPLADSTEVITYVHPNIGTKDSRYYFGSEAVYYKHNSLGSPFIELSVDSNSFVVLSQSWAKDNTQLFIDETPVDIRADMRPFDLIDCPYIQSGPNTAPYVYPNYFLLDGKDRIYEIEQTTVNAKRVDGEYIPKKITLEFIFDSSKTGQQEIDNGCTILPLKN